MAKIPAAWAAVLSALQFPEPPPGRVVRLNDDEWKRALDLSDRSQLTLVLGERCGSSLPEWVRRRIEANYQSNAQRLEGLTQEYFDIAQRLDEAGIDHVVLKGFLQAPRFVSEARRRAQYDLDLLLPPEDAGRARGLLLEMGFEPMAGQERFPTDHLPPMARKTGWRWRGDYFDPGIPAIVELHFRLWDEKTERFAIEGLEDFWSRRRRHEFQGRFAPGLHPADQLGYAAIHALRHLLRGNLKPCHVHELAYFLEHHSADETFWDEWRELHGPALRRIQSISFGLAYRWFGCRLPRSVHDEIAFLPSDIRHWLDAYAASPVISPFHPNKDELWLHLALLSKPSDRLRVVQRRLFPLTLPGHVEAVYVPKEKLTPELRWKKWTRYGAFVVSRAGFHVRTLAGAFRGGLRWWWRTRKPAAPAEG